MVVGAQHNTSDPYKTPDSSLTGDHHKAATDFPNQIVQIF